ncbi:nitronate monooxygenase family protein [Amaricoccus sp.]|uniref:NAD(P)H-dependent flavin oxidoreductase n=1 Tax=Amaricoccus sp. TaxID=1872485 RepID=UPI002613E75A|nr:nitronate monooxygenase [Amaricoccus sp.]HRO12419.1 nitronate monooxygenase [Amaricoccus sp.]
MAASPWPDGRLIELLGVAHPIVQAPMKGTSTPELAAAVSEAGGLGSLGCAGLDGAAVGALVREMRGRTRGPFNLNFFAHGAVAPDPAAIACARARLAPFYLEKGLGAPPDRVDAAPAAFGEDQLAALLADPPPVVSFHFGVPPGDAVARLRAAGARVLSTATTVAEARALESAGVDAVIAQGWEAGGHRGAFPVTADDAGVGTLALVPQVADAVSVPVIAAGGIGDGRGVAAAFALGAAGVQLGTAFIRCPESSARPAHRAAVEAGRDDSTRLSRAVSGRPARAHRNRYVDAMAAETGALPEYPLMYPFAAPLAADGDPDFQFLLYGQAAALTRAEPAAAVIARLVAEAGAVLARLRGKEQP